MVIPGDFDGMLNEIGEELDPDANAKEEEQEETEQV